MTMIADTKLGQIGTLWAAGDRLGALRIAAQFRDKSVETKAFKQGWEAYLRPYFYRQIRCDPDTVLAEALATLERKFKLNGGGE